MEQPWCVVGGWALNLWHGHQTRSHEDLEFTILRHDVPAFRERLEGMRFYSVGNGNVDYLPAEQQPPEAIAQIWCEDVETRHWRVDMMIEPGTEDRWVYKRDPSISLRRAEIVTRTTEGAPYLKLAAIMLFKAKYRRAKDEIDFDNALTKLTDPERGWLKACLETLHPGHAWTARLQAGPPGLPVALGRKLPHA
ncbi:nucleotidyl transferase AbiEii/AbiGii toxin family protein [Neorhizobium sp. Rsf11]|uniref:Nucleotidyl transferase AbiEii/AbiGii toxin family protein n=1 Tax=Neorhizobium phenanthreniclasticum TaxID=3157917 RepID=A0ABV0LZI0_9HYPH